MCILFKYYLSTFYFHDIYIAFTSVLPGFADTCTYSVPIFAPARMLLESVQSGFWGSCVELNTNTLVKRLQHLLLCQIYLTRPARAVVGPQDKQVITHYGPPTLLTAAQ